MKNDNPIRRPISQRRKVVSGQELVQLLLASPPDLPVDVDVNGYKEVYDNSEKHFGPTREITLGRGKKWWERRNRHSEDKRPSGSAVVNTLMLDRHIK